MYLVRHCESEANVEGIWGEDFPLSERGKEQAAHIPKFKTSKVVASGLKRAQETASIVYPEQPIEFDDVFNEINFGIYEGYSLRKENPELAKFFIWFPDLMHYFSKGDDVRERTDKAIEALKRLPEDAVIFSHKTLISCIVARLKGDIRDAEKEGLNNGEVLELRINKDRQED